MYIVDVVDNHETTQSVSDHVFPTDKQPPLGETMKNQTLHGSMGLTDLPTLTPFQLQTQCRQVPYMGIPSNDSLVKPMNRIHPILLVARRGLGKTPGLFSSCFRPSHIEEAIARIDVLSRRLRSYAKGINEHPAGTGSDSNRNWVFKLRASTQPFLAQNLLPPWEFGAFQMKMMMKRRAD